MKNKNTNLRAGTEGRLFPRSAASHAPPVQAQGQRFPAEGLCETDSRRTAKTEYVMRLLVSGRAPLEESSVPAAPPPKPEHPAAPGAMTLENLTFDDLLAELENL